jgi:hypothetical protein
LRQEGLKPLFEALERGFNHFNIDFYLVGATARDTWFAQIEKTCVVCANKYIAKKLLTFHVLSLVPGCSISVPSGMKKLKLPSGKRLL